MWRLRNRFDCDSRRIDLARSARRQTQHPDAYDLYLRGLNFSTLRTPASTRRAIEYFNQATALDPQYGLAWAGTAWRLQRAR